MLRLDERNIDWEAPIAKGILKYIGKRECDDMSWLRDLFLLRDLLAEVPIGRRLLITLTCYAFLSSLLSMGI